MESTNKSGKRIPLREEIAIRKLKTLFGEEAPPLDQKFCSACGQFQPLAAFGRNRAKKFGLTDWCRNCVNSRKRERLATDPDYRDRVNAATNRSYYKKKGEANGDS